MKFQSHNDALLIHKMRMWFSYISSISHGYYETELSLHTWRIRSCACMRNALESKPPNTSELNSTSLLRGSTNSQQWLYTSYTLDPMRKEHDFWIQDSITCLGWSTNILLDKFEENEFFLDSQFCIFNTKSNFFTCPWYFIQYQVDFFGIRGQTFADGFCNFRCVDVFSILETFL